MDNKNREVLLERLHDMEDFAKLKGLTCFPIYLLGGSGCIVAGYLDRATADIDILDMDYPASMGKLFRILGDLDYLDLYTTTIASNFEKRAIKINEFTYFDIYSLSKEDIIVTKLGRYSEKDIEDISVLIKHSDKVLIIELIENVSERKDIGNIIKQEFLKNVKKFRSQFNV